MKKEEKRLWQKLLSGVGLGLCVCLIPVLCINLIIIVESWLRPEDAPAVLGLTPMVVVTESMSPTIAGGDMVVTRKAAAEELKEGDIIAFYDPSFTARVITTHRIVSVSVDSEGVRWFTTKGDANNENDPKPVSEDSIVGLYRGKLPKLGKLTLFMRTAPGLLLFVLLPFLILFAFEILAARKERKRQGEENLALRRELERLRVQEGNP